MHMETQCQGVRKHNSRSHKVSVLTSSFPFQRAVTTQCVCVWPLQHSVAYTTHKSHCLYSVPVLISLPQSTVVMAAGRSPWQWSWHFDKCYLLQITFLQLESRLPETDHFSLYMSLFYCICIVICRTRTTWVFLWDYQKENLFLFICRYIPVFM